MGRFGHHSKSDANQKAIVKALRQAGASVLIISEIGHGAPDLLVGHQGKNILVEVKDGAKPPSARRLTSAEDNFAQLWRGDPVRIVKSVTDALLLVGFERMGEE